MTGPRLRRTAALLMGTTLAVTALTVAAPGAQAAPQPRTFTTTINPTQATPGVATAYEIVVKNTSTVISAMDHVAIGVPAGFTVTTGTVTAPRGGWTESLDAGGTVLTAKATKLLAPVLKGESITIRLTATGGTACATTTATWTPKADGVIIDPYVPQGSPPVVTLTPVADRFAVTSVTDVDVVSSGNQVVKDQTFTVSGEFRCGSSPAPAGATDPMTLSATGPGTLTSAPITPAVNDTTASFTATYDTVANDVEVTATWSGHGSSATSVDVLGAADTKTGTPGTAMTLVVDGANAGLPNGSNGAVSLVIAACDPGDDTAPCSNGTEIALNGDFKGLYDNDHPASLVWVCSGTACPHLDHVGTNQTGYTANFNCLGSSCARSKTDLFGGREVEEDFGDYPVYVSLKTAEGYTTFAPAGRCLPLPTKWSTSSTRYALLHNTGRIVDDRAKAAHFCVDVNGITRAGDRFDGELRIPILFVEDPRVRP